MTSGAPKHIWIPDEVAQNSISAPPAEDEAGMAHYVHAEAVLDVVRMTEALLRLHSDHKGHKAHKAAREAIKSIEDRS